MDGFISRWFVRDHILFKEGVLGPKSSIPPPLPPPLPPTSPNAFTTHVLISDFLSLLSLFIGFFLFSHLQIPLPSLSTMAMMDTYETATNNKAPFLDSLENPQFSYMEPGLEYLQYPPSSPPFMSSITLGASQGSPHLGFNALNLSTPGMNDYATAGPFGPTAPARPYTPVDGASVSPPMLTYHLSAGEMSSDSRGSGAHSPPLYAAVPRSHRYNPMAASPPVTRSSMRALPKRKMSKKDVDSDDDDEDFQPISKGPVHGNESRRENIRRQRIESEQRRRDELRDGYARLKDTLPASNQKASKVSLLDRATTHIRNLDAVRSQLEVSLKAAENEVDRLRKVNEALMLGAAGQRQHSPLMHPNSFQ